MARAVNHILANEITNALPTLLIFAITVEIKYLLEVELQTKEVLAHRLLEWVSSVPSVVDPDD